LCVFDENRLVRIFEEHFGRIAAGLKKGIGDDAAIIQPKNAAEFWSSPNERTFSAPQLVSHAQAILKELQASLNYTQGGVLAANLGRLYAYMQFRLAEVAAEQADDPLACINEVVCLLEALSDAWNILANECPDGPEASTLVREGILVA
jgi:flagellar biosynthetic protein FliS